MRQWKDDTPTSEDLKKIMTEMNIKKSTIDEIFPNALEGVNVWLIVDIEVIGYT